MNYKTLCIALFISTIVRSQSDEHPTGYQGFELGVDMAYSSSTFGGNFGFGLKPGFKVGEHFILGPTFRYEKLWFKNLQVPNTQSTNVFGGGAFVHARFFNAVFLGVEYEYLRSPFNLNGLLNVDNSFASVLFVGGGFSMELKPWIRLNAGVMYDVINAVNTPYARSYTFTIKDANGNIQRYLPIVYRVAFFFPLGNKKANETDEEEEEF